MLAPFNGVNTFGMRILKAFLLYLLLSTSIFGEIVTIELANDSSSSGELIKSSASEVYIDLGFDILKIPKTSIVRMVEKQVEGSK